MSRKTDALLKNILSAKDFNEVLSANSEAGSLTLAFLKYYRESFI